MKIVHTPASREKVIVASGPARLHGTLCTPPDAAGLVLVVDVGRDHGGNPANHCLASALHSSGLATLTFDLLTPEDATTGLSTWKYRRACPLLAERLVGAIDWVGNKRTLRGHPLGLLASRVGAAAAIMAAAERPAAVRALVSRSGRPDLAGDALPRLQAPTLLIVGGNRVGPLLLNEHARLAMRTNRRLEIVPNAGHCSDEPEALERIASLARAWFQDHLRRTIR